MSDPIRLQIASGHFNEVVRDSAQISGVVVAGLLHHGDSDRTELSVAIDPNWQADTICARVVSGDGLYEAENAYALPPSWGGGLAELDFPTQYSDLLLGLSPGAVAVRVTEGDCTQRNPSAGLAHWRGAAAGPATLLVNAFAADEVFLYVGSHAIQCELIPISGLAAFDHSCALPQGLTGLVDLTVYRLEDGSASAPYETRFYFGEP
jgi:hypothetical protein